MHKALLIILATIFSTISFAQQPHGLKLHSEAELRHVTRYKHLATGNLYGRLGLAKQSARWPVNLLSIGHTIASYQQYGFGSPYFHHGIDMRAASGSAVIASRGGKVVNIENYIPGDPAYWEVAILDQDGFIWQYHHIRRDSIPAEIHAALKSNRTIPAGTKIGEVYKWSVKTFGEYFHHIHLNVLGQDGVYHNPLLFLKQLPDKVAPIISEVRVLDKKGVSRSASRSRPYTLVAFAEDLMLHKNFKVPPYHTWISVNGSKPHTVWKFDSLPGGDSKTDFIHNFFVKKWTCGDYRCRRFAINLGFFRGRQLTFPATPGPHTAVIGVEDIYGNKSRKTFSWTVK